MLHEIQTQICSLYRRCRLKIYEPPNLLLLVIPVLLLVITVSKNIVLWSLPGSYKKEARDYFEDQINQGDDFCPILLDYFLGGITYRYRKVIYSLSHYRKIVVHYSNSHIGEIHLGYVWGKEKGKRGKIMYLINLRNAIRDVGKLNSWTKRCILLTKNTI